MKKVLLVITLLAFVATATFAHDKEKGKEKEKCEKSGSCCKKGEKSSASCGEMEKQAKVETKKEVKKVAVAKKA